MVVRELINLIGFKVDEGQLKKADKKFQGLKKSAKRIGVAVGVAVLGIGAAAIKTAEK